MTPKTGLAVGTYTATVTVGNDNATPVSFTVSFAVSSSTGIDEVTDDAQLKAWMQGDRLHVTGLSTGLPWHLYNMQGMVVYQGIAAGKEADVMLPARGVYLVRSGNRTVKVIY